jgi:hypothetical protein
MWNPFKPGADETCQACRAAPARTTFSAADEDGEPVLLCRACDDRAETRSLRPLEWFNLAALHGPERPPLHDDLYAHDGTAEQPDAPLEDAERYPAPTLEEAARDVERLVDYAMSRHSLDADVEAALAEHEAVRVLASLERRTAARCSAHVLGRAYEICAVLGPAAANWVRRQFDADPAQAIHSLAEAAAKCLPADEGFQLVLGVVDAFPPARRPRDALAWFRSRRTLDWIERNVQRPVTTGWGHLAALSDFSWERAAAWLAGGRPLSLVALDALYGCEVHHSPMLRRLSPRLAHPAPLAEMARTLEAYAQGDSAPRVEDTVHAVLRAWKDRDTGDDAPSGAGG